jgi:hypothetical protein
LLNLPFIFLVFTTMTTQKDRIEKQESEFLELKTSMHKIEAEGQAITMAGQTLTKTLAKFMEYPSNTNGKSSKTFEFDPKDKCPFLDHTHHRNNHDHRDKSYHPNSN